MYLKNFIEDIENRKNELSESLLCNELISCMKQIERALNLLCIKVNVIKEDKLFGENKSPFYAMCGMEVDLSEHDKEKDNIIAKLKDELMLAKGKNELLDADNESLAEEADRKNAEIAKYKSAFESAKTEKDKAVCKYQNEIDQLKDRIRELEESQEDLPVEPIKIAEYLMDRTFEIKNTFPALQGGKTSIVPVHDVSELRQVAEHLLVYCNHAEVE